MGGEDGVTGTWNLVIVIKPKKSENRELELLTL